MAGPPSDPPPNTVSGGRRARSLIKHALLIAASVVMIYPLLWLLVSSFRPTDVIFRTPGLWLNNLVIENYTEGWFALSQPFGHYIVNSAIVVLGAVAGAPLRLLAERIAVARRGPGTVLGTLAVNVAGSLLLGLLLGARDVPAEVVALVGTGFCGTLTTFSTLQLELVELVRSEDWGIAAGYAAASVVLGLAAVVAGRAAALRRGTTGPGGAA